MNDDNRDRRDDSYLWDGTGVPDPDVVGLENTLGVLRHRGRPPQLPDRPAAAVEPAATRWRWVAAAAVAGAGRRRRMAGGGVALVHMERQQRGGRAGHRRSRRGDTGAAQTGGVARHRQPVAGADRRRRHRQRRRRAEHAGPARRGGTGAPHGARPRAPSTRASGRRRSCSSSTPGRRWPSISAAPTRCRSTSRARDCCV